MLNDTCMCQKVRIVVTSSGRSSSRPLENRLTQATSKPDKENRLIQNPTCPRLGNNPEVCSILLAFLIRGPSEWMLSCALMIGRLFITDAFFFDSLFPAWLCVLVPA